MEQRRSSAHVETVTARELPNIALFALVVARLVLHPLPVYMHRAVPFNFGDPLLNAWILGWTSERLADGLRGLWDAPIFYPHRGTLAYSEHLLGITVLVAPIYWMTGNAVLTHNAAVLLSFPIAAVGMFLLAHRLTGRRDAAFVAAMAFAFAPMRVGGQLARVQMMMAAWLPFIWWGLHTYGRGGRGRHLAAAVAAYLLLSLSNAYMAIYSLPANALVFAHAVLTGRRPRHPARDVALAATVVIAIMAPLTIKYLEVQRASEFTRSVDAVERYSAEPRSYLSVSPESPLGGIFAPQPTGDRALFPGVVIVALAAAGLLLRLPGRARSWRYLRATYLAIIVVSFVLSLGPRIDLGAAGLGDVRGPYAWLMDTVPGVDGLRAPGRLGFVVTAALATLAALGAAALLARAGPVARAAGIGASLVVIVAQSYGGPLPVAHVDRVITEDAHRAYAWLAQRPRGPVLELPTSAAAIRRSTTAGATPSVVYQYAALQHGHPLVNGASGFSSPLMTLYESDRSPWLDATQIDEALRHVRDLGVRYVIVHARAYREREHAATITTKLEVSPLVVDRRRFGDTSIFVLSSRASERVVRGAGAR